MFRCEESNGEGVDLLPSNALLNLKFQEISEVHLQLVGAHLVRSGMILQVPDHLWLTLLESRNDSENFSSRVRRAIEEESPDLDTLVPLTERRQASLHSVDGSEIRFQPRGM